MYRAAPKSDDSSQTELSFTVAQRKTIGVYRNERNSDKTYLSLFIYSHEVKTSVPPPVSLPIPIHPHTNIRESLQVPPYSKPFTKGLPRQILNKTTFNSVFKLLFFSEVFTNERHIGGTIYLRRKPG